VQEVLSPTLEAAGRVVVMDNLTPPTRELR
jgi:hypothetical protein